MPLCSVFRHFPVKYPALLALSFLIVMLLSGTALSFISSDEPIQSDFPVFGERRDFDTRIESYIWLDALSDTMKDLERDRALDEYYRKSDPIAACGVTPDGFIFVLFEYDEVSEETVSEIYDIIDNYARYNGVENVPAVFSKGQIRGHEAYIRPPPFVAEYHPPQDPSFIQNVREFLSVFCSRAIRSSGMT